MFKSLWINLKQWFINKYHIFQIKYEYKLIGLLAKLSKIFPIIIFLWINGKTIILNFSFLTLFKLIIFLSLGFFIIKYFLGIKNLTLNFYFKFLWFAITNLYHNNKSHVILYAILPITDINNEEYNNSEPSSFLNFSDSSSEFSSHHSIEPGTGSEVSSNSNSLTIPDFYSDEYEVVNDNQNISRNNSYSTYPNQTTALTPAPSAEMSNQNNASTSAPFAQMPAHTLSQSLSNSPSTSTSHLSENPVNSLNAYKPVRDIIKNLFSKFKNTDISKLNKSELDLYSKNMNKLTNNLEHSELTKLFGGEDKLFNAMVLNDRIKNENISGSDIFHCDVD